MGNEEGGSDNNPNGLVKPEEELQILTPQFGELFQTLQHDVEILFPDASAEEKMIAVVGALTSMRMDESVKILSKKMEESVLKLKLPMKVMKMGPGGVILPGG